MISPTITGDLRLGHVLAAADVDPDAAVALRHTYQADGLRSAADLTPDKVLAYTRAQKLKPRSKALSSRYWLVFMADRNRRSRLIAVYENHGEVLAERTDDHLYFDLRPVESLRSLVGRLVVEWSKVTLNWAKRGADAAEFPVIEIVDPEAVPFPGFDRVLLDFDELEQVVTDSRYTAWRTALGSVAGVYLIADIDSGRLYVGKADGGERILGRWRAYVRDGHGGNVALRRLLHSDPTHTRHYRFSILRVFGPSTPTAEVDETEAHFKRALLSREHGLNRN
ncbi:hypothetical protein FHR81_004723 [Actinoalloteichus hoggarensis]|uniref:GIY-YIG nuclease family protein n=1 Tax=Actinoalloteichus hoggarensis TaxID=1470176 RepID=UPI0017E6EA42|nr:GIY-YIG nuclease family protein [Actinoalloteichus hoggarensis]MBB5923652.1 hypothetical protein [Actinoalloteichus hoggarensis]